MATGVGAYIIIPGRTSAQQKTLKILQWSQPFPTKVYVIENK